MLAVRLNIDDFVPGGLEPKDSLEVCRFLERAGVDIINCSSGTYESGLTSIEPASYAEGWRVYLAEEVKKVVNIPVITGGMFRNPAFANQLLKEQRADFIFLGRPLLADPEWANKARQNRTADIRPCISCNTCIARMFAGLGNRCAVNPFSGRENILAEADVLKHSVRAVVVGGGPAGIQAALSLQRHGLEVTLYEKQARLGGLMNLAGVPPHKEKVAELRDFMVRDLARSGVQVVLNQEIGLESLEAIQPDILIVATGSQAVLPTIKGEKQGLGVEASEVLGGQVDLPGQEIVIIGGGTTGCELADYLLNRGKQVTILEKGPVLAADMERKNRRALLNRLNAAGLVQKTGVEVMEIMPHQVRFASSGQEELLAAEHIVWSAGFEPRDELFALAQAMIPRVFIIGDAGQVRGFSQAILEGEMIGNTVFGLLN
ncbi:MAG: FAD-dependent oxidoreductase [Firmicutes bacterium]|nr:FAD-dependent oxidoreductase [Bacillota bacterium]